ncbi:MAG: hypothetical protein ACE5HD_08800 [Acidobacteriota bacterium]
MGDRLKSAYELAVERLAKKDGARGSRRRPLRLTPKQKQKIAAIRAEYRAKLAEREILHGSRREELAGDPEALGRLEEGYRREREHLQAQCDLKIRQVKKGGKS